MLTSVVLWIACALIPEGVGVATFESKEQCEQAVAQARNHGMSVTDCVRVDLGKPKQSDV